MQNPEEAKHKFETYCHNLNSQAENGDIDDIIGRETEIDDIAHILARRKKKETAREKMIGQSIGYRYDVNLLPDYSKLTPFLKKYIEAMGWDDLNWLEDVHMGYEEDRPAVFCRNANGWSLYFQGY